METPTLPKSTSEVIRKRLEALREKRKLFTKENARDRQEDLRRQKARSLEYRNQAKQTDTDLENANNSEKEIDRLDWTAEQWETYENSRSKSKKKNGYKSHFDLAHSTYLKEISLKTADKEKYKRAIDSSELRFDILLAKDDVDALAESLHQASERKLKRRRTKEAGGDFITEKNKQFNMKLDREYGEDQEGH